MCIKKNKFEMPHKINMMKNTLKIHPRIKS